MFLDSNIFIYAYLGQGKQGADSKRLIERIHKGEQKATTSTLVTDEVLFYFLMHRDKEFAKKIWYNILDNPNLKILAVDEKVARAVMQYVDEGLEPRDAFHAATVEVYGLNTICSYDKGFDKIQNIKRQEPK